MIRELPLLRPGLLTLVTLSLVGCAFEVSADESVASERAPLSASNAGDRVALAFRWAPIHYQDVDRTGSHALGGRSDYITRVDFDGDWTGRNNWENAGSFALAAHGYYSVVETNTHWFIVYMFFHPRDWVDYFFDTEHENDAEGVLFAIHRDGSSYGSLKAAVTVAHLDFYSFVPAGSGWSNGSEDIDGTLSTASYSGALHPVTAQEAKGHGLKARPHYNLVGDGVVYYPSTTTAEVPSHPDDRSVLYRLVDLFEPGGVWARRNDPRLFASFGSFAGDRGGGCGTGALACTTNAANAPWGWDDGDDGPIARGELATDPARLVRRYFTIPEAVSTAYTHNPYR